MKREQPARGPLNGLLHYLKAFTNGWVLLITGPLLTLSFLVVGALLSGLIRAFLFIAAGICFLFASFKVWQDEQKEIASLKKRIAGRKVRPHFDMDCGEGKSWLSISNLGASHFLLQRVHIKREDGVESSREILTIIESGKTATIPLSNQIYDDELYDADFEFILEYLDPDGHHETSESKCFNVSLDLDNQPMGVINSLNALWPAKCPRCVLPVVVNVHGLESFEAAGKRKEHVVSDLHASCPKHDSKWILTADLAKAQQEERIKRPKSI